MWAGPPGSTRTDRADALAVSSLRRAGLAALSVGAHVPTNKGRTVACSSAPDVGRGDAAGADAVRPAATSRNSAPEAARPIPCVELAAMRALEVRREELGDVSGAPSPSTMKACCAGGIAGEPSPGPRSTIRSSMRPNGTRTGRSWRTTSSEDLRAGVEGGSGDG